MSTVNKRKIHKGAEWWNGILSQVREDLKEGREGAIQDILRKSNPGGENSKCKGPEAQEKNNKPGLWNQKDTS